MIIQIKTRVRRLHLTLFSALLALMNSAPLRAEDYQAALAKGDARYRQFDAVGALADYERARQLAPDDFEALERLTRTCVDLGNELRAKKSKDAEMYYRKAIVNARLMLEKFPNKAESYFYAAASYGSLSLFKGGREKLKLGKDVEQYAKKAIELNPKFAPPYAVLGVFYREVANLNWLERAFANSFAGGVPKATNEDSEKMFLKAIELDPSSVYAHYQLALSYEIAGKRDQEVKALKEVAELSPRNSQELSFKTEAQKRLQKLKA